MLPAHKISLFRFNPQPPPCLPLTVRSVGEYDIPGGTVVDPPVHKAFTQIFWTESGVGEFHFAKRHVRVREQEIFFLLPGELHDLRAVSPRWKYHWFTLDHPDSRQWIESMGLRTRPLPARRCPVELFRSLQETVRQGTVAGDREAAHLAHALLLAAMEGSLPAFAEQHPSWVEQCRKRIDAEFADPQLNVTALARDMRVHRATLFRAFLAAYGMTPSHYLQSRRVHHAMQLLKETDASIKEVAAGVGLNDPNYLARLLGKICGLTPRQFRAAYRQGKALALIHRK
jgi:AraC-type DNA-binding domain-containing proteins